MPGSFTDTSTSSESRKMHDRVWPIFCKQDRNRSTMSPPLAGPEQTYQVNHSTRFWHEHTPVCGINRLASSSSGEAFCHLEVCADSGPGWSECGRDGTGGEVDARNHDAKVTDPERSALGHKTGRALRYLSVVTHPCRIPCRTNARVTSRWLRGFATRARSKTGSQIAEEPRWCSFLPDG